MASPESQLQDKKAKIWKNNITRDRFRGWTAQIYSLWSPDTSPPRAALLQTQVSLFTVYWFSARRTPSGVRRVTLITVVYDRDEYVVCIFQLCLSVAVYLWIYAVNDTVGETNSQTPKETNNKHIQPPA